MLIRETLCASVVQTAQIHEAPADPTFPIVGVMTRDSFCRYRALCAPFLDASAKIPGETFMPSQPLRDQLGRASDDVRK
jgi:hypothetical protein